MAIKIRHIYDEQQDKISDLGGLDCSDDPGLTKQNMKDECDINVITKRYERTGSLPDLIAKDPRYGDFSDVPSFQDSLHIVAHANEQFAALDAPVRRRFNNDPAEFLAFATNPVNLDEMVKLGLATKKVVDPIPPPAVPAGSSAAAGGAGTAKPA